MTRSLLILGACLAAFASLRAAPLDLGPGTIDLPADVQHRQNTRAIDGTSGDLIFPDGLKLHYENTGLGEPAPPKFADGSQPFKVGEQDGVRFFIDSSDKSFLIIFPGESPTYFSASSDSAVSLDRARQIVLHFKPKSRPKA